MRELLRDAIARLDQAGVASPRVDAELLLAHVLDIERGRVFMADPPTPAQLETYRVLVARRADREPLQHLLGTAAFRHLLLAVGPGVFVPRPETELLVDAVLPALRAVAAPVVVDLCSGSGALALSILSEARPAQVIAVERSETALVWLRRNAAELPAGLTGQRSGEPRLRIVAADLRDPAVLVDSSMLGDLLGRVDVVVSNPPYVPAAPPGAGEPVGPEVAHDPAEAVFAGADGLGLIPAVLRVAAALLRPGGRLAMEHDDTHGDAVPALLGGAGTGSEPIWAEVRDHQDLAGRPRFVTATRC